ncbi:MAG: hypothetical protein IT334_07010 [Thermomicrobiales bacterium]|nr:hypothetical protein [Thermomicrobiales bacterium]
MTGTQRPTQRKTSRRAALVGLLAVLTLLLLNPAEGMAELPERAEPVITESSVVVLALPVLRIDQTTDTVAWAEIARGWSSRARFGQLCVKFESADAAERVNDSASGVRAQSAGAGLVLSISSQATLADLPRHQVRFAEVATASSLAHPVPLLPPPRV